MGLYPILGLRAFHVTLKKIEKWQAWCTVQEEAASSMAGVRAIERQMTVMDE